MRSRTRIVRIGLTCLSLASVTGAVPALAQGTVNTSGYPSACSAESVPKAESERAHELFKSGKQYYDDNNHDDAIKLFRDAYKKDCSKHELLVIISRAYELKGDKAEAIRALEIFLQRDPTNAEAETYRRRIKALKESLAAAPPPPTAPPASPPPRAEERGHTPYPWLLVGVGGVALTVGIVVVVTAPALPPDCDKDKGECARRPGESPAEYKVRQEEAADAVNRPIIGGVVAGLGGALVVGGLVWHFLEPTGPVEASGKPKLRPDARPGYAGLTLGGSF